MNLVGSEMGASALSADTGFVAAPSETGHPKMTEAWASLEVLETGHVEQLVMSTIWKHVAVHVV